MSVAASRPRVQLALRMAERLLLAIAAVSLGYVALTWMAMARDQASLARELDRAQHAVAATAPVAGVQPADRGVALARGELVGRIEVPRLGVSAIVREGADAKTLRRAVGHVPDTALPGQKGNAALAGHRDTFFRKLQHVRSGERIVVTTTGGRYEYVVRETRVVKPRDVWVLDPTDEPTLTLVTCHPFSFIGAAPDRFIVRASLVDYRTSR
jgi:sortase A